MKITGVLVIVLIALFSLSDVNYIAAEREPKCPTGQVAKGGYACNKMFMQVCGTDGDTYNNECDLCNGKLKKQNLRVQADGKCAKDECKGATPDQMCTMNMAPVCGSDNFTYSNSCMFCKKWATNQALYIKERAACEQIKKA
ncbi:serine protease inhibitor Kazal-type 1-like [Hyperolius riggenbachi]|uniref:serine protease inhibitor Kazal-type 1-like n=1 Tax=Hyperolius riggenbachi TaxID=752182 RepID=UPI0035A28F93